MVTINDYNTRRYGPGTNRHWWGIAHRRWLLNSGRYVRSGEQRSARAGMPAGFRMIGEHGPELVNFRPHHRGSAIGMGDQHWPGRGCE
ncbi:hypothetical protein [Brevibacterium sp. FME37]|uniref:hypothetical protein n=1 Tax=Brevibacterium sp. FME37 TaxID=2742607 RepID=UPI000C76958F|nr:hypothetical protein [Brevibacterium sp. FME37]